MLRVKTDAFFFFYSETRDCFTLPSFFTKITLSSSASLHPITHYSHIRGGPRGLGDGTPRNQFRIPVPRTASVAGPATTGRASSLLLCSIMQRQRQRHRRTAQVSREEASPRRRGRGRGETASSRDRWEQSSPCCARLHGNARRAARLARHCPHHGTSACARARQPCPADPDRTPIRPITSAIFIGVQPGIRAADAVWMPPSYSSSSSSSRPPAGEPHPRTASHVGPSPVAVVPRLAGCWTDGLQLQKRNSARPPPHSVPLPCGVGLRSIRAHGPPKLRAGGRGLSVCFWLHDLLIDRS